MSRIALIASAATAIVLGACSPDVTATPEVTLEEPVAECFPESPNLAVGKEATASMSAEDKPPSLAVDGDITTSWRSAALPEQWIEIDLGAAVQVRCVRIRIEQVGTGVTVHRVNGGAHVDPGRELATLEGVTTNGWWLEIEGDWEFQFLRVTTLEGESSVGWKEIQVR